MTREQVLDLIKRNYHLIKNGTPIKVDGDIWDYLDTLDEEEQSVFVLEDIIKWDDEQLDKILFLNA